MSDEFSFADMQVLLGEEVNGNLEKAACPNLQKGFKRKFPPGDIGVRNYLLKRASEHRLNQISSKIPHKEHELTFHTPPQVRSKVTRLSEAAGVQRVVSETHHGGEPPPHDGRQKASGDKVAAHPPGPIPVDTLPRLLSKHDEKWNAMFQELLDFKVCTGVC